MAPPLHCQYLRNATCSRNYQRALDVQNAVCRLSLPALTQRVTPARPCTELRLQFTVASRHAAVAAVVMVVCAWQVSASVRNFKVNNVVGSASLGFRVDLAACYADNQVVAITAIGVCSTVAGRMQLQPDKLFGAPVPLLAETASATRRCTCCCRRRRYLLRR